MRQGRPWIVLTIDCQRHFHGHCCHNTEQQTGHCIYTVYCACDCHERTGADPVELLKLRRTLAHRGILSGRYNPCLPALPYDHDQAENTGCRRRLNSLTEPVELPAGLLERKQQELPGDRLTTSIACDPDPDVAIPVAVDPKTRVSKALECYGCKTKRQMVEWLDSSFYGKHHARWRLCAVCLLDALRLLLAKNITRSKTAQKGDEDGGTKAAPDGGVATLHGAKTPRAIQRLSRTRRIHKVNRRRRKLRNKRHRAKR